MCFLRQDELGNANVRQQSPASSPVIGSFPQRTNGSPAPLQRVPSYRGGVNGDRRYARHADSHRRTLHNDYLDRYDSLVQPPDVLDNSDPVQRNLNTRREHTLEDEKPTVDIRGTLVLGPPPPGDRKSSRKTSLSEHSSKDTARRRPSTSTSVRNSKPSSKIGTPQTATFDLDSTGRPTSRTGLMTDSGPAPPKRAYGKRASNNKFANSEVAKEQRLHEAADEEEEEPRYCYCNDFSYGEMVGCDADDCKREWFHLDCVGLARAPSKNGEFCERDLSMLMGSQMVLRRMPRSAEAALVKVNVLKYAFHIYTSAGITLAIWVCYEYLR